MNAILQACLFLQACILKNFSKTLHFVSKTFSEKYLEPVKHFFKGGFIAAYVIGFSNSKHPSFKSKRPTTFLTNVQKNH